MYNYKNHNFKINQGDDGLWYLIPWGYGNNHKMKHPYNFHVVGYSEEEVINLFTFIVDVKYND